MDNTKLKQRIRNCKRLINLAFIAVGATVTAGTLAIAFAPANFMIGLSATMLGLLVVEGGVAAISYQTQKNLHKQVRENEKINENGKVKTLLDNFDYKMEREQEQTQETQQEKTTQPNLKLKDDEMEM